MNEATRESTQLFMVWLTVSVVSLAAIAAVVWKFGSRMTTVFGALAGRLVRPTTITTTAAPGGVDTSVTAPVQEEEPTSAVAVAVPITAPIVGEAEEAAVAPVKVTPVFTDPAAEAAAKAEKARKRLEIVTSMAVRQRASGSYYYTVHEIRGIVGGDIGAINKTVSEAREAFEAELAAA